MRPGCGALTFPHGTVVAAGVQVPPTVSNRDRLHGTWKGRQSAARDARQADRKAGPWTGGTARSEEAKAVRKADG